MTMQTRTALLAGAAIFSLTAIDAGAAESGFFMGGSIGTAAVEANVNDGFVLPDPPPIFDEDDFGWKFLAGYDFALSEAFTLGIEGGYMELGIPVAVAIFVGAILAAIMSSADSALLGCASMIANNVLPLVRRDPSPRLSLLVARAAIPGCGIIAISVALKFQVVFDLMLDANILGLASIIVPFILGVWWKRANRAGALSAMAVGLSAWLLTLFLAPALPADFVGLGVSLLTMLVVTPLTQTIDPPRALVDSDGQPVEMNDRLGTLPLWSGRGQ